MTAQQPAPAPPDIAPPLPPTPPPAPVTAFAVPVTGVPRTTQEITDLRARRQELSDQLQSVTSRRNAIATRLHRADGADRVGLEQRLQLLDGRILQLENDIAVTGQQLAAAPASLLARPSVAVPVGARGDFRQRASFAFGSLLTLFVLAPLAFSAARLMWRRASQPPQRDPETAQRLGRLESAVDTIAIEIERVSEGQRFLTRLLSEAPLAVAAVPDGAAADPTRELQPVVVRPDDQVRTA